MDPSLISSALCKRSQAIFIHDMLSNLGENPYPSDYYSDIRTNIMSKALKAEQNCENAMAEREEQLNKTNILSDELNMEKVELARRLLKEKERLLSKREALRSLLNATQITSEELKTRRDRAKSLQMKRSVVQQLSDYCERIGRELAHSQH